ncbi:sialomucin core protein 24-like isoform X2 [Chelmon rostratus]|uniref:sialomucin core protein 24-like isoform X2 n=1 Tax=Chelmon rostratus TaxID=109905 RepID=UPI001BEBB306|nr:sialomucin core protein 24-like isoform X2 [Chelmon rostratus]
MAMDSIFATLVCFLLAFSFAVAQREKAKLTVTPTMRNSDSNLTLTHTPAAVTPSNSTGQVTVISNLTDNTTPFTSTTKDNETTTAATVGSTNHLQTSQSTTIMSTSLTTTTPGTHTPTFTAMTTPAMQTTVGYISTSGTTVITSANSSHTVNTASDSVGSTTQVSLRLNISEKNMTILFSVVLGVFAVALVAFMFHKCKHKIQYLHQPLDNTDDTDAYRADDDTLVISGGLYEGHPIYDNVPSVSTDQSQFRLEFLH